MAALYDFLQKNQIRKANTLPLVHSTEAYFLKHIVASEKIDVSSCSVFKGEKIAYFFVGRPSYKTDIPKEAEYWELPVCFVCEYSVRDAKRIYPFDSGAFSSRYPNFIKMIGREAYETAEDKAAPDKLIGTFFRTPLNYYRLKPISEEKFANEFQVDVLNEEMLALHKLIMSKSDKYDDRRFSIEVQFSKPIELNDRKLLAVVLPEAYLDSRPLMRRLEEHFGAIVLSYPMYPLNLQMYYYAIYEKVEQFYKQKGYFDV